MAHLFVSTNYRQTKTTIPISPKMLQAIAARKKTDFRIERFFRADMPSHLSREECLTSIAVACHC
jgi:hypothetical protein